ncbi:hypothetical protein MNV49_007115 [Pseudohyphozyma bogoriensis]|nr:hypothetical protein MNV49_007115 [Pseudohyphozyma bogoriensis]
MPHKKRGRLQKDQKLTKLSYEKSFEAWISINGKKVSLYDVGQKRFENLKQDMVYGYFESTDGEAFSVHARHLLRNPGTGIAVQLQVAGKGIKTVYLTADEPVFALKKSNPRRIIHFNGAPTGDDTLRPFIFERLQVTESPADADAPEDYHENYEKVDIIVWRIENVRPRERAASPVEEYAGGVKVEQRRVKHADFAHGVRLGTPVDSKEAFDEYEWDNVDEHPFLCFQFSYASKQMLELNHRRLGFLSPKPGRHSVSPSSSSSSDSESIEIIEQHDPEPPKRSTSASAAIERGGDSEDTEELDEKIELLELKQRRRERKRRKLKQEENGSQKGKGKARDEGEV